MCSNFLVILLVVTTAFVILLELVLGGYLLIAYLISFSVRFLFLAHLSNLWIVLVFVLIISINLFSIEVLLLALLSGYYEKWFSYEIFGLISFSLIIWMSAQKHQTGHDLYEVIVKEIYQEHMRAYHPLQNCHNQKVLRLGTTSRFVRLPMECPKQRQTISAEVLLQLLVHQIYVQ